MHTDTGTATSHSHYLNGDCCRFFGCYCLCCLVLFNSYTMSRYFRSYLLLCFFHSLYSCCFSCCWRCVLRPMWVCSRFFSSARTLSLTHFPRFFSNSIRLILIARMNEMNEAIKLNGLFNCVNCCCCCFYSKLSKIIYALKISSPNFHSTQIK